MLLEQVRQVEAGIERVAERNPGFLVTEAMILRVAVILGRTLTSRLDQWLKPTGLAEMEFRALMSLYSQGDGRAHPSELCSTLAQSPANLTRVSDALAERGLITRELSDQDRRRMVIHITPAGEQLVCQLLPDMAAYMRGLFSDFTTEDKTNLLADLKRVLGALDAAPEQVTQS
ncbi:MAG: MarR family transcriptional regulator [Pseudomonadota bacterium]